MSAKDKDNSSTDLSDSDDDYEDVNNLAEDRVKVYQLQHVKEETYKFSLVGIFKREQSISIEITKFEQDEFYCVITSNFTRDVPTHGFCLFDLITMDVLRKDGTRFKIFLSVEIEDPNIEGENKGNLMIWVEYLDRRFPLKTALTYPGHDRLVFYLIAELKNKTIDEFLAEKHEDSGENNE